MLTPPSIPSPVASAASIFPVLARTVAACPYCSYSLKLKLIQHISALSREWLHLSNPYIDQARRVAACIVLLIPSEEVRGDESTSILVIHELEAIAQEFIDISPTIHSALLELMALSQSSATQ